MSTGKLAVSLFAAAQLCSGLARAQNVERSIEAATAGEVVVSLSQGDLTVTGRDDNRVAVSGVLGSGASDLELTRDGDRVVVRVVAEAEPAPRGMRRETEIFVSVPRDSRLTVTTSNADVLIAGVRGAQSLRSVSGDIETEFWSGAIEAESVGGDLGVTGRAEQGDATLRTVSGEIEVRGAFDRLVAATTSGDIELDLLDASLLQLNTTNGEIDVHATLRDRAQLTAETINGDVDLEVGEEGNLSLDIGTFSGRIENCFGHEVPRARGESELQVTGEEDAPQIRVRTLNGDIEICSS